MVFYICIYSISSPETTGILSFALFFGNRNENKSKYFKYNQDSELVDTENIKNDLFCSVIISGHRYLNIEAPTHI